MTISRPVGAALVVALGLIGTACSAGRGEILSQAHSPDGALVALLMRCPSVSTAGDTELIGGVFDAAIALPPDCRTTEEVAGFKASDQRNAPAAGQVRWSVDRAIFTLTNSSILSQKIPHDRPELVQVTATPPGARP